MTASPSKSSPKSPVKVSDSGKSPLPLPLKKSSPTKSVQEALSATKKNPEASLVTNKSPTKKAEKAESLTGTLVYTGSMAWDWIGRKNAKGGPSKEDLAALEAPDPMIYGPTRHLQVSKVASHCTASHCLIIDDNGTAYAFGRNDKGQLGDLSTLPRSTPFEIPFKNVIEIATGRGHSLICCEDGNVYGAGDEKMWAATGSKNVEIPLGWNKVIFETNVFITKIGCGAEFSIALDNEGVLYSWGCPQYGQLGTSADFQSVLSNRVSFTPQPPKKVHGLSDVVIVSFACGTNHCHAIDNQGGVWSWGFGGYGRLGINGNSGDLMVPTYVPGFGDRKNPAKKIAAGPTGGMAVDSRNALHLWGKWKNSGDGGQGTPWMYPKHFQGLSGWTVKEISMGAFCLFALADMEGEPSTISWGQSCNHGELGHGLNRPRSATNAVKVDALEGKTLYGVSCGQGMALLIVHKDQVKELAVIGDETKKRKASDTDTEKKPSKASK